MSNILITGANGFIGSNFFKYLRNKKYSCFGYSRNSSNIKYNKVNNYNLIKNYDHGDDILIHLAGSNSSEAIEDIDQEYNTTRELSLHFKNRFIYISSSKVYSTTNKTPIKETDQTSTHNDYNKLKLMCEKEVIKNKGMVLRLSNVYGAGMSRKNVFNHIKEQLLKKDCIISLKRPDDISDFINIEDLCEALYKSCIKPVSKIFNIGSSIGISIRELSRVIALEYGIDEISIINSNSNYKTVSSILCCELFRKYYNWKPNITLDSGVKNWIN